MKFRLPGNYEIRANNLLYDDTPNDMIYQPDVYKLVEFLAKRADLRHIIDIGCGSASKLAPIAHQFSIIGIDTQAGIDLARRTLPEAQFIVHDLDTELPIFSNAVLSTSLIVCSDVVEHLHNPSILMEQLAKLARSVPYVIISTPDRDMVRGWLDNGPPTNPAHVMEWSGTEFVRFLRDCGFDSIPFHGHTVNTDFHRAKTTLITVTGTHACIKRKVSCKRIAAIIHSYNEVDVLPEVFEHLFNQGLEIHYFDNWSTDGSWEIANAFMDQGKVIHCERFPNEPNEQYEWHSQLAKTEAYSETLGADWIMHHDADEIRASPWDGITLSEAITHVDSLGFSAVDFTVVDFRFLATRPDNITAYQQNLTHFEFGRRPGHFSQIKCWKNNSRVNLTNTGGHDASFEGRKVFPIKFLLKHYSLRNRAQATRKVFEHRLPRFRKERTAYGWHSQYDCYTVAEGIFGWKASELIPWHAVHFGTEYVVERISGIGIVESGLVVSTQKVVV